MKKQIIGAMAAVLVAAGPATAAHAQSTQPLGPISVGDVGSVRGSYTYSITRNTVTVRIAVKDNVKGNARTFARLTAWNDGLRQHYVQVYATPKVDGTTQTFTYTGPISGVLWNKRSWMLDVCRERSHATDPCSTVSFRTD